MKKWVNLILAAGAVLLLCAIEACSPAPPPPVDTPTTTTTCPELACLSLDCPKPCSSVPPTASVP